MALIEFCGDEEFFDAEKVFNSTNLEFSYCFEHVVFDLTPCAFLFVFGIPYYFVHHKSENTTILISKLFTTKVVFTSTLWLLSWVNLSYTIWEWSHYIQIPCIDLMSPFVLGLAMAVALFFLNFDRKHGLMSSGLLTCYWILFIVLWAFVFKSQVELLLSGKKLTQGQIFRCITFFMSYVCVLVLFVTSFFVDMPSVLPPQDPFAEDHCESSTAYSITAERKKKFNPCPEPSSSFLSRIMFEWFSRMVWNGYKRPLVQDDLWDLNREDKAGRVSRHFLHIWNQEKNKYKKPNIETISEDNTLSNNDEEILIEQPATEKKKEPSLLKALVKTFGPFYLVGTFLKILSDILTFVSPQLLNAMIVFISSAALVWQGYLLAVLMFVVAIFQSIILQQYFHVCIIIGMRLRSAVISAVYRKALLLSSAARKDSTAGEIVNLMSVDAQRLMDLMPYLNTVWSAPFQIILALYFLWQIMGPSTLAGLGVMVLLIPLNGLIASKLFKLESEQMELKDERIKVMNEILNGIKVLKMYAWELSFRDKVSAIRSQELKKMLQAAYLNVAVSFTWMCTPFLVSLTTFAVYVLSDTSHVLNAQKAFVSISLFNILQFPLIMLPMLLSFMVQAKVSLKRLQRFLNNDELDPSSVDCTTAQQNAAVSVENGTFAWDKDGEPILHNIFLSVPKGSLVAVVGQVGSGKSSLISCLLGDMEKRHGQVTVQGSVAYVAQQAWIQNMSLQDNVLYGRQMDACKYQDVIKTCELKEDLKMLPASDQTEIGEKGINLSGGQKQRVSIARAVYQDADIYLLDDPLSAVDAHVGKNLFENVLGPGGCLKTKTRILVTHGVAFLSQTDKIIVLVNGRISEVGDYNELLTRNGDFSEFLKNYAEQESSSDHELSNDEAIGSPVFSRLSSVTFTDSDSSDITVGSYGSPVSNAKKELRRHQRKIRKTEEKVHKVPEDKYTEDKLMTTETAEVGNINPSVLFQYLRAVGFVACIFLFLGYIGDNTATVYSSIWLSMWSDDPVNADGTQNGTNYRLAVYGVLGFAKALSVVTSSFSLYYGAILASTYLHSKMLDNILKAPMSFFDTTPLGRIVNRFSKDIYLIDEVIPTSLSSFFETFFMSLSTLFVVIYSTPIFAALVLPIMILYWFVQRFYVRTSRQLKRLESISRSPIYSHFSETLAGASTIRAYRTQRRFITQNEEKVDTNQTAYYPNVVSNRWLALRLEIVGNLIVLFAAIFAVIERGRISPGVVGLSISYAMEITMILNWMVRNASQAETNIVAVERVEEYANVNQEAPLIINDNLPAVTWPEFGGIKFVNYSTRYREGLDLVVHKVNINISGGEKVGVVGRTGAGKSSLTLALFRIIEAAEGMITIDGLDIGKMGLHSLRSKLSIIPQDPVLFSGTLRMNLDPFEVYKDNELWDALEHSHLKTFVSDLADKLEHKVAEGGENLSVGQRQLICLARALLRKSKILVLDEATAAVDLETDDLIQETIRHQFADCTTFTIAHRINTIMDSTRVLVLDAGKVVEYGTPGKLLKAKGIFYSMAKDAGLIS
ncbi:multidrug resistance-associated protein 1-like isoform X2 [Clavelina lepadiformis]